jgi:hypothetical protein
MSLSIFNDVEQYFKKPIIQDPITNKFICPVCGKQAVKKTTIENHMSEMTCFSLKEICADTVYEDAALSFMKDNEYNLSRAAFRKSVIYNVVMRFIIFSYEIETPPDSLLCYIYAEKNIDNFVKAVSVVDSVNKNSYRIWLQKHHVIMIGNSSKEFYQKHKEQFEDEEFVKSAIIKGKVAFEYISRIRPDIFENMSTGNFLLLQEFLSGV